VLRKKKEKGYHEEGKKRTGVSILVETHMPCRESFKKTYTPQIIKGTDFLFRCLHPTPAALKK